MAEDLTILLTSKTYALLEARADEDGLTLEDCAVNLITMALHMDSGAQ